MNTMLLPVDDFSKELLKSIPKKIKFLTSFDGIDTSKEVENKNFFFSAFNNDGGILKFKKFNVELQWEGDDDNCSSVSINYVKFSDIKNNLDEFVQFEKSIYEDVEKLIHQLKAAD